MPENHDSSAWKRFWDRGGLWRALLLAVVYYGLYQLAAVGLFFAIGDLAGPAGSPLSVVLGTALPILVGGLLLVLFAWSIGWLRELFGPQPIRGRGWMWIAVAVVLLTNLFRFATLDYAAAGAPTVVAWLFAGLCIGFAEELLTRGFVVNLMRRAGHSEIIVAVTSAAIFAALHIGNAFGGQPILNTAIQVALHVRVRHLHVPGAAGDGEHHLADPAPRHDRPEHLPADGLPGASPLTPIRRPRQHRW